MNKVEVTKQNYEAMYYEELQKRFQAEEENKRLKKALINVCLRLESEVK